MLGKHEEKSFDALVCLWGNFSPAVGSIAGGTCLDIFGNLYGITLFGHGPALGLTGRSTLIYYEGSSNLSIDGFYEKDVTAEAGLTESDGPKNFGLSINRLVK